MSGPNNRSSNVLFTQDLACTCTRHKIVQKVSKFDIFDFTACLCFAESYLNKRNQLISYLNPCWFGLCLVCHLTPNTQTGTGRDDGDSQNNQR